MLNAELYVLLPLSICMIMHLSNFDLLIIFLLFYKYVHVHGASFPDGWCILASSSSLGGSGALHLRYGEHKMRVGKIEHVNGGDKLALIELTV